MLNNENFNKFYEKEITENEKVIKRFQYARCSDNIKDLNAEKLKFEGKFEEALRIIDTIEKLEVKFGKFIMHMLAENV